jgi:hypothetical protein
LACETEVLAKPNEIAEMQKSILKEYSKVFQEKKKANEEAEAEKK